MFSSMLVAAQLVPQRPLNVIPPSPTGAVLGKYGDVPVSLYTGIPDISIPVYEITAGIVENWQS